MGFDFIVIAPLLLSQFVFSLVFGSGVSFLVSSSFFLFMIVQQLVVIPVLSQEEVNACPSTLPPWTNMPWPSWLPLYPNKEEGIVQSLQLSLVQCLCCVYWWEGPWFKGHRYVRSSFSLPQYKGGWACLAGLALTAGLLGFSTSLVNVASWNKCVPGYPEDLSFMFSLLPQGTSTMFPSRWW